MSKLKSWFANSPVPVQKYKVNRTSFVLRYCLLFNAKYGTVSTDVEKYEPYRI